MAGEAVLRGEGRAVRDSARPPRKGIVLSFPSSSLGTHLSAKLRFVGVERPGALLPLAARGKQSFQDKCVTKLELGHEGVWTAV